MRTQPHYNEDELLRLIADGDENAFRDLFELYQPRLYSYLLRLTVSRQQSEDIVHDVFLKLWTQRGSLQNVTHFSAYLFRMARNKGYDGFRKLAKETLALSAFSSRPGEHIADPEERIIYKEATEFIRETVDKLTFQQRQVFLLSREQGLKQDEIARQMGISVLTVKRHLTNALNILRHEIALHYPSYSTSLFLFWGLSGNPL